ncbi:MAG TPA: GrpB family protein [Terriglobales bacterium]|nr:GrpB family protein [Terriglobales bacterium]
MADAPGTWQLSSLTIGVYSETAAEYLPYNPESPRVARLLIRTIQMGNNNLQIEHIGSTAVPGCWGKGIIDLLVLYSAGSLEPACSALDRLGFQQQSGPEAFPESRPMRVGSVEYSGRVYRAHAHVLESAADEARDLLRFRDLLRVNTSLRRAYEGEKRMILARGITKSTEYSKAKGVFIRSALAASEF